ncbi:MAG: hypothetical protein ABI691_06765 [Ginsengibacter sp.]
MNIYSILLCDLTNLKDITNIGLTLVLTVATIYLAIYTYRLVNEARLSRKSQIQPCISIHLEHAETDVSLLFIIVQNIGHGMAYDLTFIIDKDLANFGNEGMQIGQRGLFKEGMKFFPPGHLIKHFLVETRNNNDKKIQEELILTANYKNVFKESITETFHIKISEQRKSSSISPPDTYIGSIADSLKGIKKSLEKE